MEYILGNAQLYGSFHLIKIAKKEHMYFYIFWIGCVPK